MDLQGDLIEVKIQSSYGCSIATRKTIYVHSSSKFQLSCDLEKMFCIADGSEMSEKKKH